MQEQSEKKKAVESANKQAKLTNSFYGLAMSRLLEGFIKSLKKTGDWRL